MMECLCVDFIPERERAMSDYRKTGVPDNAGIANETIATAHGRRDRWEVPSKTGGPPRVRVRTIERTAIVRFEDAEIVFDESDVGTIGEQLNRVIVDEGHTRLLLNFG